jgi:3-hydroxyacyl-CoA dehydrogenase
MPIAPTIHKKERSFYFFVHLSTLRNARMTAQYQVHGDVAVITLNNPPVNGLGLSTRQGIADGMAKAPMQDAAVKAIVITGAGKAFSGGADIKEFGTQGMQEPNLNSVISVLENSASPWWRAIHTVAMGGGLELALGCHYRVAAPGTSVALPEVKLGLLPGAGGTQRLPRVIGRGARTEHDRQRRAHQERNAGHAARPEAVRQAGGVAEAWPKKRWPSPARWPTCARCPWCATLSASTPKAMRTFQFARNMVKGMSKNFPAPAKCVDAVEAATKKKFDAGMAVEREIFINLMWTAESRSLRHLFLGERAASKIPDVPADTPQRAINSVANHRRGHHGWRHCHELPERRHPRQDAGNEAGSAGPWHVATIRKNYEAQVAKKKLKQDKYEQRMAC